MMSACGWWLVAQALFAPAPGSLGKVAVLGINTLSGADNATVDLFSELVQNEIRLRGYNVIGGRDIDAVLDLAQTRATMGCLDDLACVSELAQNLDVDEVVHGAVGEAGGMWLITLKRVQRQSSRVIAQSSQSTAMDANDVITPLTQLVKPMVTELYGGRLREVSARTYVLAGAGALGLGFGSFMLVRAKTHQSHARDQSYVGRQKEIERGKTAERWAWAGFATGGACFAAAIASFIWLDEIVVTPMASVEASQGARIRGVVAVGRF